MAKEAGLAIEQMAKQRFGLGVRSLQPPKQIGYGIQPALYQIVADFRAQNILGAVEQHTALAFQHQPQLGKFMLQHKVGGRFLPSTGPPEIETRTHRIPKDWRLTVNAGAQS